jgi:hypothetical protein
MEKQTKILLGVGAVIAAYLILKPKKAVAQTNDNSIVEGEVETKLQEELARLKPIISEDERDCNIQYAMSAKQQDMPSEEVSRLRQANFISRCMEEKERRKYLIAEANRPDNVGGAAYMSSEELKILQETSPKLNPWA